MKIQPLRVTLREATGNAILDAAEYVAARDGLSGVSLQAIAERAGVAVGTLYNYFEDKPGLFDALFTRRREELFAAIDAAAKEHRAEPFAAQLHAFVRVVFAYFDTRRNYLRISLEAERLQVVKGGPGKAGAAMQQLQQRAERVLGIGFREKQLREDGADLLATILVSIIRGVLMTRAAGEEDFAQETERAISIFLHGAGK